MEESKFENKWRNICEGKSSEELKLFVPPGSRPKTQREINLYWHYRLFKKYLKGKNYKSGLELGCGRGTMSLYLNQYEKMDVAMLDISEDALDVARKNFGIVGAKGEFICASSDTLPLADNSFDIVYSIGLLEHLPDYKKTMAEAYRVLKPGGMMISLNIPAKWSLQVLNNGYKRILSSITGKKYSPKDYYRNSDKPKDYYMAAKSCGFKNLEIINTSPFPIFTPIPMSLDRKVASLYNFILKLRSLFMDYPMKASYIFSQAHFLVGYKL